MAKSKISVVESKAEWGVYLWMLPEGYPLADEDGNLMLIQSRKGDFEKMKKLAEAARYYGFPEGRPVFQPARPVTEEEFEEQVMRLKAGLVPDPHSPEAVQEVLKYGRTVT